MQEQIIYKGTDWKRFLQQVLSETYCNNPMLVCGKHVLKQQGVLDFISNSQYKFTVFTDFQPNPDYNSAIHAARIFESQHCDFVLTIGGGSAIDIAKCARRFSCMDLSKDCLVQVPKKSNIKMLAIPTTAGSGSEATHFAVLYRNNQKYSVSDDDMLPDYVVLNPDFLEGMSIYQKNSCFLDALCQAVESWWSLKANEESIAYSNKAISLLLKNYKDYFSLCVNNNNHIIDKEIYANVLLGAHYAGKAINITTTTAAHAMSYGITKKFGLAHGHAVALSMVQVWQNLLESDNRNLDNVLKDISRTFNCITKDDALVKFKLILTDLKMSVPRLTANHDIQQLAETVNIQRLDNHPVPLNVNELRLMYENIFQSYEG